MNMHGRSINKATPSSITETLNAAVEANPTFLKIMVAQAMSDTEEALKHARVLASHYIAAPLAHRVLGHVLWCSGDYYGAAEAFDTADQWESEGGADNY